MKKIISILFLFVFLFSFFLIIPSDLKAQEKTTLYYFYGEGCSHCAKISAYLDNDVKDKYPELEVKRFEIYRDKDNQKKAIEFSAKFKNNPYIVPTIFIGDKVIVGESYSEIDAALEIATQLGVEDSQELVNKYLEENEVDTSKNQLNNTQKEDKVGFIVLAVLGVAIIGGLLYKLSK